MRETVRLATHALSVACLAAALAALSGGDVLAQAKQAPPKQMAPAQAAPPPQQQPQLKQIALTEKQVEGVLSAAKEMDPITDKIPENAKPDPKITAQLDGIAKKNGFAGYDEYNSVVDNISLVLGGFDPATKKYVGTEAVQGQEGSARRSQRRAEIASAGDREQRQYRSRRQILRQARRSARRGPAVRPIGQIKRKAPEISPGLFLRE